MDGRAPATSVVAADQGGGPGGGHLGVSIARRRRASVGPYPHTSSPHTSSPHASGPDAEADQPSESRGSGRPRSGPLPDRRAGRALPERVISPASPPSSGTTGAGSCATASATSRSSSASCALRDDEREPMRAARRPPAGRHHALLRGLLDPDDPQRAAAAHDDPGRAASSCESPGRGRRPAGRGRRQRRCRASSTATRTACCSWSPTSARPTAATARGRAWSATTGEYHFNQAQYQAALDYIAAHPEIRDVLLSGGDPLTMARRPARLAARAAARDPARRVRAHRHQGAGRAAAAHHAGAVPACCGATTRCG